MNSEFEWRNALRKLGDPAEPTRDLWPTIAARIATTPVETASTRRRPLRWMAIAATLLLAVGAAVVFYRGQSSGHVVAVVAAPPSPTSALPISTPLPSTAFDWAIPDDPALARTAQNLDHASAQLQDALEQRPDAVFLVGLLNRTNSMRLRLLRKAPDAG